MTHNQIDFARLKEERRHNVTGEGETARHNVAQEAIGRTSAGASVMQAQASQATARELARHNVATEGINWYTAQNLAMLQGAQAENQTQQAAKTESEVGVQAGVLYETRRHNATVEHETQRHNIASEEIQNQEAATHAKDASTRRGTAIVEGIESISKSANNVKSLFTD